MNPRYIAPILTAGLVFSLAGSAPADFDVKQPLPIVQLSADPFTNAVAEHATELEADTFAYGRTIVGTFQTGRYSDGGASAIGWATSHNAGKTWKFGFLPGLTTVTNPSDPFPRASDPAVAYDAAHGTWLIATLPVAVSNAPAVVVSASPDGINWQNPVNLPGSSSGSDKNWITCDNTATSPYFGHCYVEWDDGYGVVHMNVSVDGGQTWGPTKTGGTGANGLGGQPLAQPNGRVVVPFFDGGGNILAIVSSDGGNTWSNAIEVSPEADHSVTQMRSPALPSAQMDASGTIYVVWHDCSFRPNCSANDIVMSTSSDGMHWTAKTRLPIDPTTSTVDHFTPGIGVDPKTSGANAHLGVIYNYFRKANCNFTTCRLNTGFITSHNGGATWSRYDKLTPAGGMQMGWIASAGGRFVGDYVAVAFTPDGLAHSVFAVGKPGQSGKYDEGAYSTATGLAVHLTGPEYSSRFEHPIRGAHSDHPRHHYPPKGSLMKRKARDVD